jgi:ParB family transcriptional regulator, chromosome partitioning protein
MSGLGRGLDSLIPKKVVKVVSPSGDTIINTTTLDEKDRVLQVSPEAIEVNPFQPRKEFRERELHDLVESIRIHGIIQPLIVTKLGENKYQLIAGERRLRSSKELGLLKVPVIVREANEQEKQELALIENIQRSELNPIETAVAYQKLLNDFNLTQDDLAKRVGKARPSIANSLRMLTLPEEIQLGLMEGKITEGHAKVILGLEGEVKQMGLYRKIVHGGMSVAETTKETREMGGTKQQRVKINYQDKDKEFAIREALQARAEIRRKAKGGEIVIHFYDDEELQNIILKMS